MIRALLIARILFVVAMLGTLVCLLSPASAVVAAKVWVATWLPMAAALDAADVTMYSDKLVHAGLFGVLGFLAARSWLQHRQRAWAVGGLLVFGVFTEMLQAFIPGREAALGDWMADALGLVGGMLFAPSVVSSPGDGPSHRSLAARVPVVLRRP